MVTHVELIENFDVVRRCLADRFNSFIHVTPFTNFERIRTEGLIPHRDMAPPVEIVEILGARAGEILCLHPLGSARRSAGTKEPPLISLAVLAADLPERVGLDWSYSCEIVIGRMQLWPQMPIHEFVGRISNEFGSIISYDRIPPEKLRLLCRHDPPTYPLEWQRLAAAERETVTEHR
jgi:hypothetical protein